MKVQVNVCRNGEQPHKARERVEVTVVRRSAVHRKVTAAAVPLIPEPVQHVPSLKAVEQASYPLPEEPVRSTYTSPYSNPADRSDEFDSFFSDVTTSAERSAHTAGFEPQVSDAIDRISEMIEAEEEKVRLLTQAISEEQAAEAEEDFAPAAVEEESTADEVYIPEPEIAPPMPFDCSQAAEESESEEEVPSAQPEENLSAQDETEDHADASISVRFFDRGENGQLIEVDRSMATGQEVRTYNGDRLTRICGVIRKNGSDTQQPPQSPTEDNTLSDETEE